jgi:hypothetical protein
VSRVAWPWCGVVGGAALTLLVFPRVSSRRQSALRQHLRWAWTTSLCMSRRSRCACLPLSSQLVPCGCVMEMRRLSSCSR